METIRISQVIEKDGEIHATGLPCKKGQQVEMILLVNTTVKLQNSPLTGRRLLNSGVIGLWKDRQDIQNTSAYSRQLREQAQNRRS